jgi:predicted TIM-barrel fold metal-dependent hydrolase
MEKMIIDMHAHVGDPETPVKIAQKATDNPAIEHVFGGFQRAREMSGATLTPGEEQPSTENFIKIMDSCRIKKAVAAQLGFADMLEGLEISSNDHIAEILKQYPDRFIGYAGVDPRKGQEAIDELVDCIKNRGFVGCRVNPNDWGGFYLDDYKLLGSIYDCCQDMGIPMHIHTGWDPEGYHKHCTPIAIDDVANDFPRLKISMEHFGFPWAEHAYVIARKHPNVYLTLAWEMNILVHHNPALAWMELEKMKIWAGIEKIMWGTDYPAATNIREFIEFIINGEPPKPLKQMGFKGLTEVERWMILGGNAARFLGSDIVGLKESIDPVWTSESQQMIDENVPVFARKMARGGVEKYARSKGITEITKGVLEEARKQAGR